MEVVAVGGLPEVAAGDDLAALIAARVELRGGDVLTVAHKVVSKAEARVRRLADVVPSTEAVALAQRIGKEDARHVQVVLDESSEIVRAQRGVIISRTHQGFVCANAGVDASNAAGADEVVLLPVDPDGSARALRAGLLELTGVAPGIVISDSFGRAWRHGQCDVAIGVAGLHPLEDWRGRTDAVGRELKATWIAIADAVAAAAELVRGKDSREPVVLVRGLERHVVGSDGPGAAALLRDRSEDLFA